MAQKSWQDAKNLIQRNKSLVNTPPSANDFYLASPNFIGVINQSYYRKMTSHFQHPTILQKNEIIFSATNQVTYDTIGLS